MGAVPNSHVTVLVPPGLARLEGTLLSFHAREFLSGHRFAAPHDQAIQCINCLRKVAKLRMGRCEGFRQRTLVVTGERQPVTRERERFGAVAYFRLSAGGEQPG